MSAVSNKSKILGRLCVERLVGGSNVGLGIGGRVVTGCVVTGRVVTGRVVTGC